MVIDKIFRQINQHPVRPSLIFGAFCLVMFNSNIGNNSYKKEREEVGMLIYRANKKAEMVDGIEGYSFKETRSLANNLGYDKPLQPGDLIALDINRENRIFLLVKEEKNSLIKQL